MANTIESFYILFSSWLVSMSVGIRFSIILLLVERVNKILSNSFYFSASILAFRIDSIIALLIGVVFFHPKSFFYSCQFPLISTRNHDCEIANFKWLEGKKRHRHRHFSNLFHLLFSVSILCKPIFIYYTYG